MFFSFFWLFRARVPYIKVRISEQRTKKMKCFFLFFGSFEREYLFIKHGKATSAASCFVKKIPNPSGSGVAYFKATAPSLANTPKMSVFHKWLIFTVLTLGGLFSPPSKWQLELLFVAYWFVIYGILPRSLRHLTCSETISDHVTEHLCRPRGLSLTSRMPIWPIVRALKRRKS